VAGIPHHVTQRGNRRLTTFFHEEDYTAYREFIGEWCPRCGVEVWACCLMPNSGEFRGVIGRVLGVIAGLRWKLAGHGPEATLCPGGS
jgi:hypothetical protein